jgi:ABC-type uncharacterized transport system ATPase subunit
MSALLEIDDRRVTFGGTAAVRGISLTVEKGETQRIKTVRISAGASIAAALETLTGEANAG